MSIKQLPNGQPAVCFEIKPHGDGRYYLESFGFKSLPFDFKDIRQNKEWFSQTINGAVHGTVQ